MEHFESKITCSSNWKHAEKYPPSYKFKCSIMDPQKEIANALADVIFEAIREDRTLTEKENNHCIKLLDKAMIIQ